MLFFDDEDRNIEAVSKMGVTSILVGNEVNLGALRQGLSEFSQKSSSSGRDLQNLITLFLRVIHDLYSGVKLSTAACRESNVLLSTQTITVEVLFCYIIYSYHQTIIL
ncbi:magnesium-dependent phosphatase 1 [Quercus suber]|uniref:Magnesium-dependent phosphatase 1 n=1 Tax=Quercus suber TaxID=58331 RepID=A0AAW0KAR3_QUESU